MSRAKGWSEAAAAVQRLAVLLEAGVAPLSAVRLVAGAAPQDPVMARAASATSSYELGAELTGALLTAGADGRAAWAPVAATWIVAADAGAPLGPTLARLAEVVRALAQNARRVEVALSGPIASARILVLLPVVGVLFGVVLGFDTVRVLFATPPGWVCLAAGTALMAAAATWSRRMLRRARRNEPAPGLASELVAVALAGGAAPDRALRRVGAALRDAGLPDDVAGSAEVVDFARTAGVPAGALLRAEAEEDRRRAAADAERAAVVLGVRLMLPLGACVLPAFLALAVMPVVISLVGSTVGSL